MSRCATWGLRGAVFAGAGVIMSALARPALASPASRLVYSRGAALEGCPDESALRRAVAARVGYDPFFPYAPITVVADIERVGDRLVGRMKLLDDKGIVRGARTLSEPSDRCAELVSAMGLAISIALDTVTSAPPAPADAPEPARSVEPVPPVAPPVEMTPTEPHEPALPPVPDVRLRPFLGIGMLATTGSEPAATAGVHVYGGLRWRWMSLALDARGDLQADAAGPNGGNVSAQLFALSLVPCAHVSILVSCMLVSGGLVHSSGAGVNAATTRDSPYFALGGRVGVELPLGRSLVVPIFAELRAPLTRQALSIADGEAWRTPPASAALSLGLKWHFP